MFGVVIAGRLVQTEFEQVAETKVVFNIPNADDINHIVVFMTGLTPFPDGVGGSVYFCWPSADGPSWYYLGSISNAKPSAIFKVSNLKKDGGDKEMHPFGQLNLNGAPTHVAQIGISAEPLEILAQQTPAAQTNVSTLSTFAEYSRKMLENFTNYASSFAVTQAQMTPNPTENYVPMATLYQWFTNFERRLQQNPNFWKS